MATKSFTFSSVIFGSPMITSEKLIGSENYLSWSASVELWFMDQGYEDHLVTQEADIPEVDRVQWRKIDAQLCSVLWQSVDPKILLHLRAYKTRFKFWNQAKGLYTNDIQRLYKVASSIVNVRQQDMDLFTYIGQIACLKKEFLTVMPLTTDVGDQQTQIDKFFMVLTLIGLRPDLQTVRYQILGSSSVPSLDDVFARLLCISSTQTLPSDKTSDSSVLLHGRPPRTAHVAQSSDPQSPQPPSSSTSQGISLTDSEYDDYLRYQATKSASVAQTGPEYGEDDWHRTRLSHPSLSKFQKMVLSFSSLSLLACESCQLGKHTRVSFPKRLNNRTKSPFELVQTDVWGPCRIASTLGFQYFVTFIDNYSRYTCDNAREYFSTPFTSFMSQHGIIHQSSCAHTPQQNGVVERQTFCQSHKMHLLWIFQTSKGLSLYSSETHRYFLSVDVTFLRTHLPSRPLQVYHRRHRVAVPPSLAEVPADSLPIPSASPALALPPSADLPIALRKGWRQAMVDEMAALHSNGTWDLVVLPSGKSTVGCRWVYTVKVGPDGQVDRLKARLVAKGYTQVYGSDYGDTFSPVAKIASVRLLLSMAAMRFWPLYQLDIKNVFLHGDLAEEVYMEQPPGFVAQGSLVYTADHFVFYHHNSSGQCIYLVVYVDDIVITGSDQNGIQKLKQHLFTHFQTKDLGKLKYFLGIEIAQSSSGVVLSQRKIGEPLGDLGRYRRLVGKLKLSHHTRPDISFPAKCVVREQRSYPSCWAGSPTDRRSTSGYCVFIGGNLISWKSKKQDVVARSSAEAEYRAMALATCELIWLKHLLRELRFGKDE
ncbi:Retrovirus-related Pol polyprotein from transposon RE1 [Vitis vinifera]|uniref:Retrovirus-related Pol polyprotein from transposon RE1 n=1 Tax=Vitis vinifera TaxID=29760 RepID=A0A438FWI0_VITVI|nr:Retrovirus-related Pol polyprotein from transposon RE1 [Vitis vinifera]